MFDKITSNFNGILDKLRRKRLINEEDLDGAMREIRLALLEADVSLPIIKEFVKNVKEQAIGQQVIKNVKPDEMIVKIVNDELIKLLGTDLGELELTKKPTIILMTGLQGSGKTTASGKLAVRFKNKFNKKTLLISLDIYRPAAQKQLEILANQNSIDSLKIIEGQKPIEICKRALAIKDNYDIVIFDTAGRLYIDEVLMAELKQIKELVKPDETFLVADSLLGQDSVNVAKEFNEQIGINDIILTRIDGDGRGGCALSMKISTGRPIRYISTGEKVKDFDLFHPERIASRILDMGDIVTFVEKAEEIVEKEEMEKLENKLKDGSFNLNDLLNQLRSLKKFGGILNILSFLPGANKLKDLMAGNEKFGDKEFQKQEVIISSMTMKERENPDILNSSRKFRIAKGSGTTIQDVNSLLKKFKTVKDVVTKVGKMDNEQIKNLMKNFGDLSNF